MFLQLRYSIGLYFSASRSIRSVFTLYRYGNWRTKSNMTQFRLLNTYMTYMKYMA